MLFLKRYLMTKKIILYLSFFLLVCSCSTVTPIKGSQYYKKPYSGFSDCLKKTTGRYNFSEYTFNLLASFGGLFLMYDSAKSDSFWSFLGSSILSGAGFNKLDDVKKAADACKDYDEWKKNQKPIVI